MALEPPGQFPLHFLTKFLIKTDWEVALGPPGQFPFHVIIKSFLLKLIGK